MVFRPGRYVLVRQLTGTWTACYRAVSPGSGCFCPLPREIDMSWLISTVAGRCWAVTVDFNCRRPISGGISQGREKEEEEKNTWSPLRLCDPSPAGDFFSPCGEKKSLPMWGLKYRSVPIYRDYLGTIRYTVLGGMHSTYCLVH
ncbi:hypothetical protein BHE74_00053574 [Ensete ventricosum]|nr:hypothetical protein BHE74_00053574 [Ensete ventricosum]